MRNKFDMSKIRARVKKAVQKLPRNVGTEVVQFSKDRFRQQQWIDLKRDKWPKRKDDRKNALLIKSGRLRNSIRIIRVMPGAVLVGSNVEYSDIHNEGGTTHPRVTDKMKRFAWAMHKKTGQDKWKGIALTNKSTLDVKIPKRKFLGNSAFLNKKIKRTIDRQLKVILS